jgi:tetratricopeptide (TPR) repeat protein
MIPQNQTYLTERENLQKISSDLLIMKYTQTALIIVNDPNQNVGLLTQALNYEKKAANLDSNNPSIQSELKKLTYYQAGFSYFAGMNWASAIEQLSSLTKIDPNYANGFAMQLLYEAYIARGNAYYDSGFYLDARNQFEAAESLSWDLQDKMNLFMVELDLAKTLGKLESYKDAASYYKYAVEAVDYFNRGTSSPSFVNNLVSAITMYSDGQFEASYRLFETTLKEKQFLFTENEFSAKKGMNIAIIAAENNSSVEAITERNGLAQQTTITEDQTLFIPTLN